MQPLNPVEMRVFRVEVISQGKQSADGQGIGLIKATHQRGINALKACRVGRLFFLQGSLTVEQVEQVSETLLADPVTETYHIIEANASPPEVSGGLEHTIDVTLLPGVTDPAAENLLRAAHLLGIDGLERAATGQRYFLQGDLEDHDLRRLAAEVFANPVIQRFKIDELISPPFVPFQQSDNTVEIIALREADDDQLLALSADRRLALNLAEMQAIRDYFRLEGRDITDAELEMLAQTWSEHCVHKTFRANITYSGPLPGVSTGSGPVEQTIDGLLKTYIRAATEKVNKPWVQSAFVDNAGIITFDERFDLAFKVETHNHPSALEPFGGSNTGVGGVVRDVLGVSARPIANTDVLCFGPPDLPIEKLLAGVLHPDRIADGVVHGIEDYGNKMGIPTVNGAVLYHPGYTANPLVFCGCLGLLPHDSHPTGAQAGDLIIVIGGRTGRDGLRGATFSSMEMDSSTSAVAGSAVQIGNPIQEKQVQEVILCARDEQLYNAITDCGAGGLSSAVGEMGRNLGARVLLETVPLKYPGLRPWEVWLSEAQERMVLAVPPDKWPRLQEICAGQDVEAVNIGVFEQSGRLYIFHGERVIADILMDFLHDGIPQRQMQAVWLPAEPQEFQPLINSGDFTPDLLKLLAHPDIRSKEHIVRRYDHEVQAGMTIKPLVGADNHGPSDAAVLVPLDTQRAEPVKGVALANGICPAYGEIDPYAMAWAAVDEAIRNLAAVGTDPDQVAILDNFCWGNASLPDRLGSLVRCVQGCHDAAVAYGVPYISGKDSLNNEYMSEDGQRHAIPGTLLISAVGIVPDVRKTVTMDLKQPGNVLYLIGETRDELGGSHYNIVSDLAGGVVPQPVSTALDVMRGLYKAIGSGTVQACHDVSEGGLAVTLAEMCVAGRLGAVVDLRDMPGLDGKTGLDDYGLDRSGLFSESLSRFIVEVREVDQVAFDEILSDIPHAIIGRVSGEDVLRIDGRSGERLVSAGVAELEEAWRGQFHELVAEEEPVMQKDIRRRTLTMHTISGRVGPTRVLILHANGTNRDRDAMAACELAGGEPEIVHVNQLISGERNLLDYHMLVVPGGFSYGDDLGAGVLWALDLRHRLRDDVERFISDGRPVLGICNGFQTLVKSGLLPGQDWSDNRRRITLTYNESSHFECRWVYLKPNPRSPCLFTEDLDEMIYCPVAHGEGRVAVRDEETRQQLWADGLITLTYVDANGNPAGYPANPNGSMLGIAGICNPAGNVLGLMPHLEDHVFDWQHPRWRRGESGMTGLRLFKNGIKYA